jgi:hypothetical protein
MAAAQLFPTENRIKEPGAAADNNDTIQLAATTTAATASCVNHHDSRQYNFGQTLKAGEHFV